MTMEHKLDHKSYLPVDANDFQKLCLRLIRRLYPQDSKNFHQRGDMYHADHGIDIEGESQDTRIGVQCKTGKAGKPMIRKALNALKRYPHKLDRFILICSEHPSTQAGDEFRQCASSISTAVGAVPLVELWGPDELEHQFGPYRNWAAAHDQSLRLCQLHSEYLRCYFQTEPVWGQLGLTLEKIYVDLSCGVHTWGEIANSIWKGDQFRIDPFHEGSAPRKDLLRTTLEWITKPEFNDFIVIQGTAGAGKSSFTYRLGCELAAKGYHPIRIRLRDMDLGEDPLDDIFSKIPTSYPDAKFPDYSQLVKLEFPERTVLILDGWDELTLGANQRFREKVTDFLNRVRTSVMNRSTNELRVVLTGRPTADVTNPSNLQASTPILTIRPFTPDQLRTYFEKLETIYSASQKSFDTHDVIEDYEKEWNLGPAPIGTSPRGSIDVIGWPLLAHAAYRLLGQCEPDRCQDLLHDRTMLLRCLTEYCCRNSRFSSDLPGGEEIRARFEPADLRVLVQETAIAITHSGSECISKERLHQEMQSRVDAELVERRLHLTGNFDIFVVNYVFKTRYDQLGCEFVHKSLREFGYAEAIVDTLKRLSVVSKNRRDELSFEVRQQAMIPPLLRRQWLTSEVRQLLESQIRWEILRELEGGDDPSAFRRDEPPTTLDGWVLVRDRLAKLWGDWNLSMLSVLEEQPQRHSPSHLDHAAADARLGDALFRICAVVHATIAHRLLVHHRLIETNSCFWKNHSVVTLDESSHQTTLFNSPDPRLRFFSPNISGEANEAMSLRAAFARINAQRPTWQEELPERVDLIGIVLIGAPLARTSFRFCDLSFCNLSESNLSGSDLEGSEISKAWLEKANLERANLSSTELVDSCLSRTRLQGASFKAACLRNTDLRGAHGLSVDQIIQASEWETAQLDPKFRMAMEAERARQEDLEH